MIESTTDDTSPFLRPQSMSPLFLKPDRCPDGACRAIRYGTRHRHPSHEHGRLDGHILCHEPQIVWTNPRGPCLRGMPISTSSLGFYDCLTAFPLCGNVVRLLEPFTSPSTKTSCPVFHWSIPSSPPWHISNFHSQPPFLHGNTNTIHFPQPKPAGTCLPYLQPRSALAPAFGFASPHTESADAAEMRLAVLRSAMRGKSREWITFDTKTPTQKPSPLTRKPINWFSQ